MRPLLALLVRYEFNRLAVGEVEPPAFDSGFPLHRDVSAYKVHRGLDWQLSYSDGRDPKIGLNHKSWLKIA